MKNEGECLPLASSASRFPLPPLRAQTPPATPAFYSLLFSVELSSIKYYSMYIILNFKESAQNGSSETEGTIMAVDEKLQIPVSDDWHALFSSAILGRIQAITNAEYSVDKSTLFNPKVAPSFSVDILGKSYLIYQKFNTITDNSGKPRQIPAGVYAKLASSVNLTDERMIEKIRPVKRMNDSWVVYGDTPNQKSHEHGHASRILKNKDMLEEFGLNVAETSKLWDLMEQRKIVPIFTMDVTIDACAARSIEFIETILAENKYNPKFTKSNIIL